MTGKNIIAAQWLSIKDECILMRGFIIYKRIIIYKRSAIKSLAFLY